jgi:hypothetical protein
MKEKLSTYSVPDRSEESKYFDEFVEAHPEIADLSSERFPVPTAFEKLATAAITTAEIRASTTGYTNSTNQDGGEDLDPTD